MTDAERPVPALELEKLIGAHVDDLKINVLPIIIFVVDMTQYEELATTGPEN
jgi:hypothetical protein